MFIPEKREREELCVRMLEQFGNFIESQGFFTTEFAAYFHLLKAVIEKTPQYSPVDAIAPEKINTLIAIQNIVHIMETTVAVWSEKSKPPFTGVIIGKEEYNCSNKEAKSRALSEELQHECNPLKDPHP